MKIYRIKSISKQIAKTCNIFLVVIYSQNMCITVQ